MSRELLRIDLTSKSFEVEEISEKTQRKFLGERGLGAKILYDELPAKTDPLSPENIVVIATGILSGTEAVSSGRYEIVSKSPLTGAIASSNSGGVWAVDLRKAGYDAIVLNGKADKPTYLWIDDGEVEFRDASDLWGRLVIEVDEKIRAETAKDARILQIGIAGEKQSLISNIMNDKYRAAGRTGMGAVLGSKNLKAVAVRGTKEIEVASPLKMKRAINKSLKKISECPVTQENGGLMSLGTPILVNVINSSGILPTRNFQEGIFDKAEQISGENLKNTILKDKRACFRCPIECGRWLQIKEAEYGGTHYPAAEGESLEYETIWAFGAQCGVSNLDAIARANYQCNEYGLDTISTGSTIGFAMELFQRGIITKDDIGFELNWGDEEAMIKMLEHMAHRKGFGDTLALGSRKAAEKVGKGSEYYSINVKGLELPAYDPRGAKGIGLNYATSNRGAAHVNGYTIAAEIIGLPLKVDPLDASGDKVDLTIAFQNLTAAVDSSGNCLFLTFAVGAEDFAGMIAGITGWNDYTADEFVETGERIYALERMFNKREGFGRKDDVLPKRLLTEEMPEGPAKGQVHPLEGMLSQYYEKRGYDEEGWPTEEKLSELDISA